MHFSIRSFTTAETEERHVLLNRDSKPLFWPAVFVTMEYRNRGRSPKTALAVLRALGTLEVWGAARGFDPSEKLSRGDFISVEQAEDLAYFLRLKRPEQDAVAADAIAARKSEARRNRKVARLEAVRPRANKPGDAPTGAGAQEAANRIRWVIKYLKFHLDRRLAGARQNRPKDVIAFEKAANRAISRLEAATPRVTSGGKNDEALVGLDLAVVAEIEAILDPATNHPGNPFREGLVRDRNFLIWRILLDTGMRRSELAWLRVEDIDYASRRVWIRRSKTIPRRAPIGEHTAELVHAYITTHWAAATRKTRATHGYLLINKTGGHLAVGALNDIFDRIRERALDSLVELSPHTLRRTWNDRFSALVDQQPESGRMSQEQEKQVRNRLQGWSPTSEMGAKYSRRHIRQKADAIGEALANSLRQGTKDDK